MYHDKNAKEREKYQEEVIKERAASPDDWFGAIERSLTTKYCGNCGDAAHVEIDARMRCCACGRDNGTAGRVVAEFERIRRERMGLE